LVSLRAKRSNLIVEGLLRHFVPRNDTLIISQKHFTDDSNYHNLDTSDLLYIYNNRLKDK
ncbi:MAG: hypothetical protein ABIH18_01335, partial [Candidatus Omnitrophota bacterium]